MKPVNGHTERKSFPWLKPMAMVSTEEFPAGNGWLYEPKYDGFRCLVHWGKDGVELVSRRGKSLNESFPEIAGFCGQMTPAAEPFLPLVFDTELVYLLNNLASSFQVVQRRSRMKNKELVHLYAERLPCMLAVFDVLQIMGKKLTGAALGERKKALTRFFTDTGLPHEVSYRDSAKLQLIRPENDAGKLWRELQLYGEGMIAKRSSSVYEEGTRSNQWLKKKAWRHADVVFTGFDEKNGYVTGAVAGENGWEEVVQVKHGFNREEYDTLAAMFRKNGTRSSSGGLMLQPAIAGRVRCIGFDLGNLREPQFSGFRIGMDPHECTRQKLIRALHPLHESIEVTKPDKPVWPGACVTKDKYLYYLQKVSPAMLPHLAERLLTLIRYPHGVEGESFYQKQCPDYAPEFVRTGSAGGTDFIICDSEETLLWLGNQLALEFHTPFNYYRDAGPCEIVLDLDPPSAEKFELAVEAALDLKEVLHDFRLASFVKTSGRKGLQVHIPLPAKRFTYDETRLFTAFVSRFLCEKEPDKFTVERLKKNRGGRLYVDYLQHDAGKTLIAPYSPRGTESGLCATPLYWEEVVPGLEPDRFTLDAVLDRLVNEGDPFRFMREADNGEVFAAIVAELGKKGM